MSLGQRPCPYPHLLTHYEMFGWRPWARASFPIPTIPRAVGWGADPRGLFLLAHSTYACRSRPVRRPKLDTYEPPCLQTVGRHDTRGRGTASVRRARRKEKNYSFRKGKRRAVDTDTRSEIDGRGRSCHPRRPISAAFPSGKEESPLPSRDPDRSNESGPGSWPVTV